MKQFQDLVTLAPWTFIFQICNLLILTAGVKHFLFKPVQQILAKRKEEIEASYTEAEKAEGDAQAMKEEYETRLASAKEEAAEIVKSATARANARGEELVSAARAEAAALKSKADAELFEMTAKYGTPYFSNYINSDMEPSDVRSMCCRLRLDLRELRKKSGGYFGSGESTGSIGVVTINMPRIAYLATDEADFFKRLDKMMDIAARSLKVKRNVITKLLNEGLYPYTKYYLGNFDNHFSTIGLVGMNEAGLNANWIRADMTTEKCQDFTKKVLNHMRERLSDYQEQYGDLYNLEATPAESTSYRLAKHDVEQYPDIITASQGDTPYYTNSSHLPVSYTDDIFSALDIQDELQTLYTSGTVFHAFLGEKLPDWKSTAKLVRKIAENYKLPYYTISPTYSICRTHGYIEGEHYNCPTCGASSEVYSRITGYYRPVQNWNVGKRAEFNDRNLYDIDNAVNADMSGHGHARAAKAESAPASSACGEALLFTTKTCPNCAVAKRMLAEAGIGYRTVDAEENAELVERYGVMQAPTLIVPGENGVAKYANASNIGKYAESVKK